ncbi:hypothetical protein AB0C96_09400 [Streptomyces sp. NPDC048506]|uniref:hypothetical protein n=1 Tax=Streptomyces sp. NPDC048506 TaxID=3155028 RepID=UPI00343B3712
MSPNDANPQQVTEEKLSLLKEGFDEVLDATKHQDDKIARLLTGVAFLTAAVLALAALNSGTYAARVFRVDPYHVPLALIFISIFLLGVAVSVVILLAGLTQPLGLPGITNPSIKGAQLQYSQLYFLHISQVTRDEWKRIWEEQSSGELREKRLESLIFEVHSLANRTTYKNDRTTEGVSVFSLSLLAFGGAIISMAASVNQGGTREVELNLFVRLALSLLFGIYFWLQLALRIRKQRQEMRGDETADTERLYRCRNLYAITVALLIAGALIYAEPWYPDLWLALMAIIGIVNLSLCVAAIRGTSRNSAELKHIVKYAPFYVTLVLLGGALVSGANGWYAGQLLSVGVAVLALLVPGLVRTTLASKQWRRAAQDRNPPPTAPAAGIQPDAQRDRGA